jgi:membrane protease YdiL (CAAX protease family)
MKHQQREFRQATILACLFSAMAMLISLFYCEIDYHAIQSILPSCLGWRCDIGVAGRPRYHAPRGVRMKSGMLVELAMVAAALGFGVFAILRTRAQGGSLRDMFGLRLDRLALADLLAGMAITACAMAGIFLTEYLLGAITRSAAPAPAAWALAVAAFGKLAATFKEEFIMRSLLLSGLLLALRGRAPLAIGISAVAFGLIHLSNPGASALSVIGNSLGGAIYGTAFILARSLWLPIGLHFAWNFTQGPLLGFPVSGMDAGGLQGIVDIGPAWLTGGAYGPEAGAVGIIFRFVVIALLLAWIALRRGRAGKPLAAPGAVPASPPA